MKKQIKTEVNFKKCEVLQSHCRTINGKLFMFEPFLSGILSLPDDIDTKNLVMAGCLLEVFEVSK